MDKIIVTPDNVVEVLLTPRRFSSCPSLRRMCTEAYVLSMSKDRRGLQRVAAEAYGSLSDAVLSEIKKVTGVEVQVSRRTYVRAMDVRKYASDLLGLQIEAGTGLNAFSSMCLWRDQREVRALFVN